MLKLATIALALSIASTALAGQNCYPVGTQYVCQGTGSDIGDNTTSYQVGRQTVIQENNMATGQMRTTTCYQVGATLVCN